MTRFLILLAAVPMLLIGLPSCRKAQPPAPETSVQASSLPPITVKKGGKLLLTYYSHEQSTFQTAQSLADVPETSRSWVRVIDLSLEPDRRRDQELVYVADLRQPKKDGTYDYVVMSRAAFEERARTLAPRSAEGADGSAVAAGRTGPAVILYATAWCPACKSARKWLETRKIPFVEKDIEKDPAAAAELMAKARRAGLSTNGVPVLDVRGTLVPGFDAQRILSLLAS
jgi:glutaredoxin